MPLQAGSLTQLMPEPSCTNELASELLDFRAATGFAVLRQRQALLEQSLTPSLSEPRCTNEPASDCSTMPLEAGSLTQPLPEPSCTNELASEPPGAVPQEAGSLSAGATISKTELLLMNDMLENMLKPKQNSAVATRGRELESRAEHGYGNTIC